MSGRRANHEGSTPYLRPDGRWHVRVSHAGKRVNLYAESKAAVIQRRNEFLTEHRYKGLPVSDGRVTVASFLEDWLERRRPKVRESTYRCYRNVVRNQLIPHLGTARIAKLTARDVEGALQAIAENDGKALSPRSVQLARTVLRAAVQQAVKWEELARNVVDLVDAPKVEREEITPLSAEQAEHFLEGVQGDRLEALYVLAFTLGLRQGELLGLRWRDIDFDTGELRVAQARLRDGKLSDPTSLFGPPKSGKSKRSLTMPTVAVAALKAHRKLQLSERVGAGPAWQDFDLVFTTRHGRPLGGVNVGRYFKRHLRRLELPIIRFHDCRHTAASLLLARGVPLRTIQEVLGHSQISLTADTYSHVLPALKREAADAMDSIFPRRVSGD